MVFASLSFMNRGLTVNIKNQKLRTCHSHSSEQRAVGMADRLILCGSVWARSQQTMESPLAHRHLHVKEGGCFKWRLWAPELPKCTTV